MEPIHAVLYSDRHPLIWACPGRSSPGMEAVPVVMWELYHHWAGTHQLITELPCHAGTWATTHFANRSWWICPIPCASRAFLQQDVHHFFRRLHLTPCPVEKVMDVTLLYLCSSPSIVIKPIYYTNAFAWHIDFVVLEMNNFTGAEKKATNNPQLYPPPPITNSGERNAYLLASMLEQVTNGWLPFHTAHQDQYNCRQNNTTVDCAEV